MKLWDGGTELRTRCSWNLMRKIMYHEVFRVQIRKSCSNRKSTRDFLPEGVPAEDVIPRRDSRLTIPTKTGSYHFITARTKRYSWSSSKPDIAGFVRDQKPIKLHGRISWIWNSSWALMKRYFLRDHECLLSVLPILSRVCGNLLSKWLTVCRVSKSLAGIGKTWANYRAGNKVRSFEAYV